MYTVSVLALIFIVSVDTTTFISFPNNEPEPVALKPSQVKKQFHSDDKDSYTKRQVGEKAKVEATMKDTGNGYYEFQIGNNTCKFYVDKRQSERSLMCNAKMCSNKSKSGQIRNYWSCEQGSCSIKENLKTAQCDLTGTKNVIDAPTRNIVCPTGQVKVGNTCRILIP